MTLRLITQHQFFRFLTIGLSNTLLSYSVFILMLQYYDAKAVMAQGYSYAAGIIWSYFWNRNWTFRSNSSLLKEGGTFLITQLALLLLSSVLLGYLIDQQKLNPTLSWISIMGLITILNFYIQKHIVYKN